MDHTNPDIARRASRYAGLVGLLFLVLAFLSQNPPFYSDASNATMLSWVHAHPTALYVEGVRTGTMMVLMVGFLAVLMWRAGLRDPWRSGVWALLGASMAIDMVWSGVYDALAFAGQHGIGDSGVLALATLTEQMTFTDGFLWGIAVLVICVAALRTRTLAAPVAWLGVVTGVFKVLEPALQVAVNKTSEGFTGPLGTVLLVFWVLAASLTLVIRPGTARAVVDESETQLRAAGNTRG
ncbi:MAG TPA: hypothetical protein VFE07_07430 [Marmoricola sp.]|nr:hypothetical protein [Marmoricola sp.]